MKKRGIFILVMVLFFVGVYALNFEDRLQSDFSGTYNNTFYNSSGFIQLNASIPGNTTTVTTNSSELIGNETGLVSYWRFNESLWNGVAGEVRDVLGKSNGTALGTNTTFGLFGNAGNFSGVLGTYTNEVQIANQEELNPGTGSFTITGWAKSITRGGNGYQLYVAKRDNVSGGKNGYYLGLLEGSGIKFVVGDGTNRVDTSYVNVGYTNWFHFAAVINRTSNQSLIYINGSLGASANIANVGKINNSWNLSIGNDEGQALLGATWQYPVKGQIDEVAIWNRVLSSSEIQALYQKGLTNSTTVTTNGTNITSGTYESVVKDAGGIVQWENISWNDLQAGSGVTTEQGNVLLMHFEGNANDENGINNGIVNGGAILVTGKSGQGYYLDGTNDYIEVSDSSSLDLTSDFSLGIWVNFTSLPAVGQWQGIMTKGSNGEVAADNHNFFLSFDNNIGWGPGIGITWGYEDSAGSNYQARYQFTPGLGEWYHITGVFNDSSNTMTLYVNGTQVAQSTSATATPNTNAHPVFIGRNQNGSANVYYLNALVDDAFISNKALSASEVQQIYSNSVSSSGLKFQVRTSNDNSIWTDYFGSDGTLSSYYLSPGILNLSNSRYFQYKSYLTSSDVKLYNVTITYQSVSDPAVSLDSPENNYLTNGYNIDVTCSASSSSELSNMTLYYDKFSWGALETKEISGTSNTTTFSLTELGTSGTIRWNCLACNVEGNCYFAASNKTIVIDNIIPNVNLISPENGTNTTIHLASFYFNVTDNRAQTLNCSLIIDGIIQSTNSSVIANITTMLESSYLTTATHLWQINCSDGLNSRMSEARSLTVNPAPFWAKSNLHMHTTNSDGTASPATLVSQYKSLGYDIISITDHNPYGGHYNNYTVCDQYSNLSENFICFHSEEFTLGVAHTTLHHITSAWTDSTNNIANVQAAINDVVDNGGFAIVAHPSWGSVGWSDSELLSTYNYTGVEVYNHKIEVINPGQEYSENRWETLLQAGRKVFAVAADDMHLNNSEVGFGWIKVYTTELTPENFVERVKSGYFYASTGPSMDAKPFEIDCDGLAVYHMGETANCSAISIDVTISATPGYNMKNISLIKDGTIISNISCNSENCSFNYSAEVSSSGYYRLDAADTDGKYIWGNPIWVTKIALPVVMTIHSPENNSATNDYTPILNVSLNQNTTVWYELNGGESRTLCTNCDDYDGAIVLPEGENLISIHANNSDNIIYSKDVSVILDFNKTVNETFDDNWSVYSIAGAEWSDGEMTCPAGVIECSFVLQTIVPSNNITSFDIEFIGNNTGSEVWLHEVAPIHVHYNSGSEGGENYLISGEGVSEINEANLTLNINFYKKSEYAVDLLDFFVRWTEFTVPLISNVSVSSVTSSSAIVSWNTDTESNSTIFYGPSSDLGSEINLNDSVTSHRIVLSGLSSSTSYFYKVGSCTESSCAEYPQEPYLPYSFTTQAVSDGGNTDTGGSGSSGGGGGGGVPPKVYNRSTDVNIEFSSLPITNVKKGTTSEVVLTVINREKTFLNNCGLRFSGSAASWMKSSQSSGLSQGEKVNYLMTVSVPEKVEPGKYSANVLIQCDEGRADSDIYFSVYRNNFEAEILSYEKKDNQLVVTYSLQEYANTEHALSIDYFFKDMDNVTSYSGNVQVSLGPQEERPETVSFNLPKDSFGEFVFEMKFNDGSSEIRAAKEIFLPSQKGLSGLAISDSNRRALSVLGVVLVAVLFIVFAFWTARRLKKKTRRIELIEHSKSGQRGRKFITVEI